jgi:nickel/cobalt transporter (NicO) family protein
MVSIIIGSLVISFLHAFIPNHWLPVVAIGRKEGWTMLETTEITFISGLSHVVSTIIIGIFIGLIGKELAGQLDHFTHIIAPSILILVGLYFIHEHYKHHHFHINKPEAKKRTKKAIIMALIVAMFLSPCMEIEAYFLLAGAQGWYMIVLIASMYAVISISGMLLWVRLVYKGVLKLNWHKWEHNAGLMSGGVLIVTGILSFFIS